MEKRGKEERAAYHLVPIERTMEDLDANELTQEEKELFTQANIDEITKDIEALDKIEPKMGANIQAYKTAKQQWQSTRDDLQARLDYYNALMGRLKQPVVEVAAVEQTSEQPAVESVPVAEQTAEVAPTQVESTPVAEQTAVEETPQATNEMQEAELAPAAEPVGNSDQEKPTQKFGYRVGQKVYLPRRGSIRQAEILEFGDSYIRVRYENIDGETITMNFAADYFEKLKKQAEAMMEADLENGEKGQKAVEPVEENKPKVRGRKQVEKAVEKMRKADAEGNALEVLNNIQTAELNAERGDEGAITSEELAEIDALKKKYAEQGYEVQDLTGKEYVEGWKVTAEFEDDATLPEGEMVVKRTRKPFIMKDGVMVQKADIIVAKGTKKAEPTLSQTSDQVGDQIVDNTPGQSGVEDIQEPRSVEETLENGGENAVPEWLNKVPDDGRNFFVYVKFAGENKYQAIDLGKGETVDRLVRATMLQKEQLQALVDKLPSVLLEDAEFQIRDAKGNIYYNSGKVAAENEVAKQEDKEVAVAIEDELDIYLVEMKAAQERQKAFAQKTPPPSFFVKAYTENDAEAIKKLDKQFNDVLQTLVPMDIPAIEATIKGMTERKRLI